MVASEPASDPASGSVKANEPIISPLAIGGKYFCFCSSVPTSRILIAERLVCMATVMAVDTQCFPNSSASMV